MDGNVVPSAWDSSWKIDLIGFVPIHYLNPGNLTSFRKTPWTQPYPSANPLAVETAGCRTEKKSARMRQTIARAGCREGAHLRATGRSPPTSLPRALSLAFDCCTFEHCIGRPRMFKLLTAFCCCKAGRYGRRTDLIFCTCMLFR
jgi:hypothetical protein